MTLKKHNFHLNMIRILIFALCVYFYYQHEVIDVWFQVLYSKLENNWIFRHDSFEPCLAVSCFAIYIGAFFVFDKYIAPKFKNRLDSIRLGKTVHDRWDEEAWNNDNRILNETLWYIGPLLIFDVLCPRRHILLAQHESHTHPLTLMQVVFDVMSCLFFFDTFFFISHYTLHHYMPSWLHRRHHSKKNIRAGDAIRHSIVDGSMDVVCSIAAINITKAHPLSRAIYNILVIYLITEAHCSYDIPFGLHHITYHITAGPRVHKIHHDYETVNYAKIFTHWDRLIGRYVEV
jgi:sterol desaturase/sphingolipid hydroxylase (fatty acid hydroxylase superfamily)